MLKVLAVLLFLSIPTVDVSSNGATYGRIGEVVFPLADKDIRMVSEHISGRFIDNPQLTYEVECVFVFSNLSAESKKLEIGFPIHSLFADMYKSQKGLQVSDEEIVVYVDGEQVRVNVREGIKNPELGLDDTYPLVFVFPVEFGPSTKKTVEIRYKAWYYTGDGHYVSGQAFKYVTRTGALWKGNIEDAEFRFELPAKLLGDDPEIIHIYAEPAGYKINGSTISWSFTNWKPKEDISIQVSRGDLVAILGGRFKENVLARDYPANRRLYSEEDFFWPISDEFHYPADLIIVKSALLWFLRNEIYARRGYKFSNPFLSEYFSEFSWYKPRENFSDSEFSAIERKNLKLIRKQEKTLEKDNHLRYVFKELPSSTP